MERRIKAKTPPDGFRYQANIVPLEEEQELTEHIRELPLKEFEFHGYVGRRRTMSFGWHRDKGVFDEVVGISLLSPCNFRFRRKVGAA